jgi:hypothetical protein
MRFGANLLQMRHYASNAAMLYQKLFSSRFGQNLLQWALTRRGMTFILAMLGAAATRQGWHSGKHTNILYLTFLFSSYLTALIVATRGRFQIAMFVIFLFFLYYNPLLAPPRQQVILDQDILPGQSRVYRFNLHALVERKTDCGDFSMADIFVQGNALQPGLHTDLGPVADQVLEPLYAMQRLHARVALPPAEVRTLVVTLANSGQQPMSLYRSPEMSGSRAYFAAAGSEPYFDGVYMFADNDKCRIVIHPKSEQPR